MEKVLRLKTYVDGGINDTPFPNSESQVEIGEFRYDAKRMGGAPTITASVNYPSCLDDVWTDNVYAEFNGEKYHLKQTPTSSYNNESTMYKHDLELVSERSILDNVYFFDAVVGEPEGDDKPVSNSTKVVFFGGIREFAARLNSSLQYSHLDYTVVVDEDILTEEKLMSFEDQFFSNVLQEIYNTYEVPYYFEGKTIHIGWAKNDVDVPTFAYGVDDALLSITKNNANFKIVNRITGTGSSDNIPFYYPNNSPKGDIEATTSRSGLDVKIFDYEKFSNEIGIGDSLVYSGAPLVTLDRVVHKNGGLIPSGGSYNVNCGYLGFTDEYKMYVDASKATEITLSLTPNANFSEYDGSSSDVASFTSTTRVFVNGRQITNNGLGYVLDVEVGENVINIYVDYKFDYRSVKSTFTGDAGITYSISPTDTNYWTFQDRKVDLLDFGLFVEEGSTPQHGDTITQTLVKYVKTSQNLMPSIYRESDGAERFYNATNNTYAGVEFNNPYVEGRPKEHIIALEDIKPTIKGTFVNDLRIDMFSEFAYDEDDNDETYEDEDGNVYFKHPYFYGKLRVMDFNLFDHAIEQQPMTISFTSGHAGACNFEIGVTEDYPQKNPVQVDEDGNLVRDENGMIVAGVEGTQQFVTEFQERQQDTSKYEVWIALRKEEETYGILMPQVVHRPKACTEGQNDGDTFVILGINLPQSYILNAEKNLESELIKYMKENNDEKFTFSVGFSRIYFEENEAVLDSLSENSKITITYNNQSYDLYVSSFSYNMSEGDVLPEIRVELNDTLAVSQNALQAAISEVKGQIGKAIGRIDVVGAASPYFIRKDADDEAQGRINFVKGIKFGEGGKVDIMDNNSAKLTIEYLEVTKKASFTSLEIQEKTHVGGQILVTPAALNCGEVEELDDAYRCYFQTKGADGDEIFNQFAVGDQAICQTFNAWGSKYYWRLVVGVGEDYIDLSKTDCDEDSGIPSAGDKIIQMGNRSDAARQNAIVIAAYGDGSPYIIQYKGINSYELPSEKIVTKLSSTENIFTGKVHMEMGSDGLEDLQEFINLQALAGTANTNAANAQSKANTALSVADMAQQSADTANTNALQAGETANAATQKADAAIEKAEAAQEGLDNMEVGGQNLLRNSGFTGDYLSEQLADESVLESASELYSAPLDHWTSTNTVVNDSEESSSGKEVSITNGMLSQKLYYKVVKDESYVISFKAKGTSLKLTVGSFTKNIALSTAWEQYEEVFTTTTEASTFEISNATCSLCEVQLEKGTKRTAWSNSPLDNSSDRAYYQSMKYLSSAIVDGSTDILGGLVLTNQIKVGNYANQEMIEETGGMNGSYTDAESPFLWGGGTLQEAIATIAKHEGGTATPAGEIPFAVTHGGKVILNDAMVRGTVHIGEGSSGLEDFQEWSGKQSQIDSASSNASSAQSVANEAKAVAANAQTTASNAQTKANEAQTAASNAQTAANNAKGVADAAAQRLTTWATDGVISPVEKPALKNELAQINADYNDIIKQLEVYEIENESTERATYVTRFTSYRDALNSLINAAEGATIPSSFATAQSDYYTARTSILDAIAKAAKKVADDAQATADEAKTIADNAVAIANSYQYIATALTNGSTYIDNGLILTSLILLGTMSGSSFANKAGVNGVYSTDNSPAFWAGGTLDQATTTITKYLQDPTFQPTDAELATMAKAVITHGGRAILNDIILRGTVYATDGEFAGKIHVDAPDVNGRVSIDDDGLIYYGQKSDGSEYRRVSLGGTCEGASIVILANDASAPLFCTNAAVLAIGGEDSSAIYAYGDIWCSNGSLWVDEIRASTLKITGDLELSGHTSGLRTATRVITTTGSSSSPNVLSEYDFSVLIEATSGTYYITLPSDPIDGQEYWLETKGANLMISSYKRMWSHWNAAFEYTHTFEDRGVIRFKYYYGASQWTYTWVESH